MCKMHATSSHSACVSVKNGCAAAMPYKLCLGSRSNCICVAEHGKPEENNLEGLYLTWLSEICKIIGTASSPAGFPSADRMTNDVSITNAIFNPTSRGELRMRFKYKLIEYKLIEYLLILLWTVTVSRRFHHVERLPSRTQNTSTSEHTSIRQSCQGLHNRHVGSHLSVIIVLRLIRRPARHGSLFQCLHSYNQTTKTRIS